MYKFHVFLLIVILSSCQESMNIQYDYPFQNPELTNEERITDLILRLSIEEKASLMLYNSTAIERLGIPKYNWWNECLHGVGRAGKATVFPQAIGMAATFDDELIFRVATAISDEARAKHHAAIRIGNRGQYVGLSFWTPNINIFRDPRWGRGQETYGEDPYFKRLVSLIYDFKHSFSQLLLFIFQCIFIGQVIPFVRIIIVIIQLFRPIAIPGIAPPFGSNTMILIPICRPKTLPTCVLP